MIFFDELHSNERLRNRPNGITMGALNAACQKDTP